MFYWHDASLNNQLVIDVGKRRKTSKIFIGKTFFYAEWKMNVFLSQDIKVPRVK